MIRPAAGGTTHDIYLGRQSILDRKQNLFAFELLFRSGDGNSAEVGNQVAATATVISYAMSEFGLESVLGRYKGFINVDGELLMNDVLELLPRDQIVLEILETVQITPEVIARCRKLRDSGFSLAMDDFVKYDVSFKELLELVDIVKVDIMQLAPDELANVAAELRGFGVKMLAEKVETADELQRCVDLGFGLLQGYYFAKPVIIQGKRLSSSELVLMRLLGMLMADHDTRKIERVFKQDPGLSINMLRLVNSVACGVGKKVTSLASALQLLGRQQVQRWLQLLLFAQLAPNREFPSPLLQLAATRGRFLELLVAGDKALQENAFMTGIMSLADTLLSIPLAEIIALLPVSDEARRALLERGGKLGKVLELADALEVDDSARLDAAVAALPEFSRSQINEAQVQALAWANSIAESAA